MQKLGKNILRLRATVAGVLLLTFAFYYINIALFLHYHVVDGVTIVHSHICTADHTDNPLDSDAHSTKELTLISTISDYLVESPSAPFVLNDAYTVVQPLYIISDTPIIYVANSIHPPLRGPPAEIFIG